ncbi:endonuclease domain-containing protein [Micromonospora sp. CPCC 206061]|uniref:endonuclease domain-containing protein n=1 Tax=Micromonospora sp. CPCC 206061 TaxID=3122410 RepID=UPI002FF0B8BE
MGLPKDDASALEWLLFQQSGVITWPQAVAELGAGRVRHLLKTGRWRRVCRGLLIAGNGPVSREQQWWVAVLAAGEGALLAGLAAARAGGLRGKWRYEPVDVLIPYGRYAADLLRRLPIDMAAVRVRRTQTLPESHRQRARPDRTSMARSVVDAAQWMHSDADAQSVLAAAYQQRRVTPAELGDVVKTMPKARRHALMVATIADLEGGAEALSEINLVRLCRRHGLPVPDLQERRTDASGRVRYLDGYWREWRVHIEIDGAHHMDAGQWAADMRRQNEVWIAGDRILRFAAFDLRTRPAEVARQIRAALEASGWRPRS